MMSNERATKKYVCRYFHDGCWWSVTIDAYSMEDAETRARKLSLQLDGELIAKIPARLAWAARILCKLHNFFKNKK